MLRGRSRSRKTLLATVASKAGCGREKAQWLDELKPFVAGAGATPPNQEEVAARLGAPIATLRTWLQRLRQRYRDLLRTEVANTVV